VDITIKGRHTEVGERFRAHALEKLAKLERYDHKSARLDVEVCEEHNPRQADMRTRVELTFHAKGPVIRAEAAAPDAFAALDLASSRLQTRLQRSADRRRIHHGARTPISLAAATAAAEPLLQAELDGSFNGQVGDERDIVAGGGSDQGPLVVREKTHHAGPMTLDQALFEMELVGHDFFLFVDAGSGLPSVVYRRRGYDYGVIRVTT
jgi:ribosomal subunit interface protein